MNKPTTLKDIAIKLKLSPSSVSKALRCCPDIGDKTKQRVHNYARKIGYQSNPIGANLRTKRTYLIGVVVPDVTNNFYAQALSGIISVIAKSRYHTLIAQSNGNKTQEKNVMQDLANRWVDGLIVLTPFPLPESMGFKKMLGRDLPIIAVSSNANSFFNCVYVDPSQERSLQDHELGITAAQTLLKNIENNKAVLNSIPLAS